jgi:hypothetical protein
MKLTSAMLTEAGEPIFAGRISIAEEHRAGIPLPPHDYLLFSFGGSLLAYPLIGPEQTGDGFWKAARSDVGVFIPNLAGSDFVEGGAHHRISRSGFGGHISAPLPNPTLIQRNYTVSFSTWELVCDVVDEGVAATFIALGPASSADGVPPEVVRIEALLSWETLALKKLYSYGTRFKSGQVSKVGTIDRPRGPHKLGDLLIRQRTGQPIVPGTVVFRSTSTKSASDAYPYCDLLALRFDNDGLPSTEDLVCACSTVSLSTGVTCIWRVA